MRSEKDCSAIEGVGCVFCGMQQKIMKRCTRCRTVFYCSRKCQIDDWKRHREKCVEPTSGTDSSNTDVKQKIPTDQTQSLLQQNRSSLTISIKCNHKKHKVTLYNVETSSGNSVIENISKHLRIPVESMKIITKGKLLNKANVKEMLLGQKCKNFQAFGEEAEDEEGLDVGDIEAVMEELHVSRNKAILSLRSCNGDLIDAILELGNKL